MIERFERQVEKERRDLQVLQVVIDDGPIGIVSLSQETGIPEHKVRYSLRMLEADDLVEPTQQGAVPAEEIAERVGEINDGINDLIDRLSGLDRSTPE